MNCPKCNTYNWKKSVRKHGNPNRKFVYCATCGHDEDGSEKVVEQATLGKTGKVFSTRKQMLPDGEVKRKRTIRISENDDKRIVIAGHKSRQAYFDYCIAKGFGL